MTTAPDTPQSPYPCHCGSTAWWWRPPSYLGGPGGWVCNTCHQKPPRVRVSVNRVYTLRKAPTTLKCDECTLPIKPGESYCEGVEAGVSLDENPERLHRECWQLFVNKERRPDETSDQQKRD